MAVWSKALPLTVGFSYRTTAWILILAEAREKAVSDLDSSDCFCQDLQFPLPLTTGKLQLSLSMCFCVLLCVFIHTYS